MPKIFELKVQTICQTCGSERSHFWLSKEDADFYRCESCGFGYRRNLPSQQELYELYDTAGKEYYLEGPKVELDHDIDHTGRVAEISPYRQNGRLVDVGCSTGSFLRAAQKDGWESYGIDLSESVAQYCQSSGLRVQAGDAAGIRISGRTF